jgi:hypothetical protein
MPKAIDLTTNAEDISIIVREIENTSIRQTSPWAKNVGLEDH